VATLHLHFDESGNWKFNPKGSRHYVLAMVYTYDPLPLAERLTALRFAINKTRGGSLDGFHACIDPWPVRTQAIQCMVGQPYWRFASVVVEKRKVHPSLRAPESFYPKFAGMLLKFVLRGRYQQQRSCVLTYADSLPMDSHAKREGVMKAMKLTCAGDLPSGTPHHVFSHCEQSNAWIQVADYCCWAVYRKWENGKTDAYDMLRPKLQAPELVVTAQSAYSYY
jgi:hypothetical protein